MFDKMAIYINKVRAGLCRSLLLVVLALLTCAQARAFTVDEVPNVRLKDASQYVSDPSSILSAPARDSINLMLARLEKGTGIETAVVMLPTIGDADIFDFAHQLFRTWGIGKKQNDNGLLVLFVMDQRKVRFTTGYGLEGTLPDALCRRIQMQHMVPHFKQSHWDKGMVEGVRATVSVLDGTMKAPADGGVVDDVWLSILVIVLIVALSGGGAVLVSWRRSKCPRCGRHGLRKVGTVTKRQRIALGRYRYVEHATLVCRYCGHTCKRTYTHDVERGAAVGAAMGSMGRGSGGGFSGGSFGGGSTGGGGATSGW